MKSFFSKNKLKVSLAALAAVFGVCIFPFTVFGASATTTVVTTVRITICGDAVVGDGENCDAGYSRNHGQYSTSITEYQCYAGCYSGAAPYCGDEILQTRYGEECDDANNTAGDACSAVCQNETEPIEVNPPAGGGGGGGGSGAARGPGAREGTIPMQNPTRVIIDGRAYPGSKVYILQDGRQVAVVQTGANAEFHYEATEVTPGPVIFGFWAEDSAKSRSIVMTTTFQVVQNAVTTVSGLYLPPTISISQKTIKQGEKLDISGESVASSTVLIYFDAQTSPVRSINSLLNGKWDTTLDTVSLENEKFHTVKSKSETLASDGSIKRSGFSQSVGFYVGAKGLGEAVSTDVNKDGKVSIVDFSVLLFYWGSAEVSCDFNFDGKVNLTDFSIMLYSWTG
ncbi:MAG: dockerin type I domain-containing protein [Candidatus Paceibacterota bacterium]|jgi:cysteine-rich repeat protein|nr:dockerin type I domain-containing protein [Candidatus Paceibacterota bacterium]